MSGAGTGDADGAQQGCTVAAAETKRGRIVKKSGKGTGKKAGASAGPSTGGGSGSGGIDLAALLAEARSKMKGAGGTDKDVVDNEDEEDT